MRIFNSMSYTVVCLKSGLACVAIFGESPDFLDKSYFAKIQKSGFLGKVLFFEKRKSPEFLKNAIFKKMQKLVIMLDPPVRMRVGG